jgi:hypothetical protein
MALTVNWGPIGQFDPTTRDSASNVKRLIRALLSDGSAAERETARNEVLRRPDFKAQCQTTDNTAASTVIDLTAKGITFPANTLRLVRFKSIARSDTDTYIQDWEQYVLGGTTPKLVGSPRLLGATGLISGTAVQYGYVESHSTTSGATVTNTAVVTSAGVSLANFSSGIAVLTVPSYRTGSCVISAHLSEDAGTVADTRFIQVRAATATTFTVNSFDIQNATPAISSPNGVNNVDIRLFLLPPPTLQLAISTNNVVVQAGFNATDNVDHLVEAFVGRTESAQPSAT